MQWCSLLFEIDFNNLFRVVPCAAGVGHEDRLIEAERCNRNQIANEIERFNESEGQCCEEHSQKDVQHSFLRIVPDWTVRINRDRHWPHAQKTEGHQSEGKNWCSDHMRRIGQSHGAEVI